jgi:glycosyltransferase involved in cell wall biosynthesis
LKFWYGTQKYESHSRVAEAYQKILARQYRRLESLEQADVVILHIEPYDYRSIYNQFPILRRKYVISYCVWEASELPVEYQRSLNLVQEVWTCSHYCVDIIRKYHPRVFWVPHIIERDMQSDDQADGIIRRLICFDPQNYYFLAIGRSLIPRKNLAGLLRVFESTASSMPNGRLIIKGMPTEPVLKSQDPRVIYLPLMLSEAHVNSLYKAIDVYVSSHHSEGWGLTLSDAMLFSKPVVATGYSGNLEFMNGNNSFLVRFVENFIRNEELWGPFTPQMKWADPDPGHLQEILLSLYDGTLRPEAIRKATLALEESKRYSMDAVTELVLERMKDIVTRL